MSAPHTKYDLPLISVVIITRNREELLPRAIKSVIAQTHKNLECIVVEDASTDGTPALLDSWAAQDPRIRPVHLPHPLQGELNVLRNAGIKLARGSYVALLDDDDEWLPEKLEKQLRVFEHDTTGKIGFVGCDAIRFKVDGTTQLRSNPIEGNVLKALLEKNIVHNGSVALIKASALKEVGLYDEKLIAVENRDLWTRLAAAGYTYGYVREPLVHIYLHESNHHYSWNTPRQKRRALDFEYMFNKHRGLWKSNGMYSKGLRALAVYLLASRETARARHHFAEAIRFDIRDYRSWIGYALACFGRFGTRFYWWYTQGK